MPAQRSPAASSQKSPEGRYSQKSPCDHEHAGYSSRGLEHCERDVGHTMSTGAVRQRLVEMFRKLGEAGAGDHEDGPGGENQ